MKSVPGVMQFESNLARQTKATISAISITDHQIKTIFTVSVGGGGEGEGERKRASVFRGE